MAGENRVKTTITSKTASVAAPAQPRKVISGDEQQATMRATGPKLTEKEWQARRIKKYATTTSGFIGGFGSRYADGSSYSSGGTTQSQYGNFYSPQLSTDFLEKPQNLRERRAWYRSFYSSNEFVRQAIDLHTKLPLSKIRLEKPKCENPEMREYVYTFFEEMCNEIKLTKTLLDISHDYNLLGNCQARGSRMRVPGGYKNAEDVHVGDLVLTDKGRFRRVTKECSRKSDKIVNITATRTFDPLRVTTEHPVEVYRDDKFQFVNAADVIPEEDYIRVTWPSETKDVDSMVFVEGNDEIVVTDYGYDRIIKVTKTRNNNSSECRNLLLNWLAGLKEPTIETRENVARICGVPIRKFDSTVRILRGEIGQFTKRLGAVGFGKGSQVLWLPVDISNIGNDVLDSSYEITRVKKYKSSKTIDIDDDFCYLAGYWLGDGTLSRDSSRESWGRGLWQIGFGDKSNKQYDRVKKILTDKLGDSCVREWEQYVDYKEKKSRLRYLKAGSNPAFIEWWSENFGETEEGENPKHVPEWFLSLPVNKLRSFLAGIIDSDGCSTKVGYMISMISRTIMDAVRDVTLKCGVTCGYKLNKTRISDITRNYGNFVSKDVYCLTIKNEDSTKSIEELCVKKFNSINTTKTSGWCSKWVDGSFAVRAEDVSVEDYDDYVFNFEVEEDHTYQSNGFSTHNCFVIAEDHNPYEDEDKKDELKEKGKIDSNNLFEKFKITDKDPNYKGWRKLIILPPDQVRIKKIPLSDESIIEFLPDPETRKAILRSQSTGDLTYIVDEKEQQQISKVKLPERIVSSLKESGAIPLDTDPSSGTFVYHIARQKSQYEILGVSILESCVNTLLLQDKLRQAQTSIASRHMTPIRIVWADGMSDNDVDNLREQVDMALVDPDFSIVANYQINWEEMGSNGRLLELSTEYEHVENSLFAGLGVTREILTGEGSYAGNRVTLEVMNSQYLMFREELQDYVENYLFKPIARKKGFIEKDKYGREKLIYPSLSFTRLAIRDNDTFFDQVMQLYNKGSVSIDVILDMLNIDPSSTRTKIEADLFTVNDFAFNQLMVSLYQNVATKLAEQFDASQRVATYLDLHELPAPPPGTEAGGLGGMPPMGRFAATAENKGVFQKLSKEHQDAINSLVGDLLSNPEKLEKVAKLFKDQSNGTKNG